MLFVFIMPEVLSAHHGVGWSDSSTGARQLAAGLLHPVIGVSHLAFILGYAVLAAAVVPALPIIGGACIGSLAGAGLVAINLPLPLTGSVANLAIVATVAVPAVLLLTARPVKVWPLAAFTTLATILHGAVFTQSTAGADMTATFWAVVGFVIIQLLVSIATVHWARTTSGLNSAVVRFRLVGGVIAAVAVAFTLHSFNNVV